MLTLQIPKRSLFWSNTSSLAAMKAVADFLSYVFKTLLKITASELHQIFGSRLEIGDAHIAGVFDEVRTELQNAADYEVDFSFFELYSTTSDPESQKN